MVVDLSEPVAPTTLGTFTPPAGASIVDVELYQNHAMVSDQSFGIRIVNVANPLSMYEVGAYGTGRAEGIAVHDGRAYLSTGGSGVEILNVDLCTFTMLVDGFESGDTTAWSATVPSGGERY